MAQAGDFGLALSTANVITIATGAGALASFLALYGALLLRAKTELQAARACVLLSRLAVVMLAGLHILLLYFCISVPSAIFIPSAGILKPIAGLVVSYVSIFTNSHWAFRWITVMVLPLFIVSDVAVATLLRAEMECRGAGRCVVSPRGGYDTPALHILEVRNYMAVVLQVWVILFTAVLCSIAGCVRPRYPARYLSLSTAYAPPGTSATGT